jgi:hypothetical protein
MSGVSGLTIACRGSVATNVNSGIGHFFQTNKKVLHQGDPLSLISFNISAYMVAIINERMQVEG